MARGGISGPQGQAGEVGRSGLPSSALTKTLPTWRPAPAAIRTATLAPKTVDPQLPTCPFLPICFLVLRIKIKLCEISEHQTPGHLWAAR